MKVLVVGGGGREHALAWKIAQSPLVERVLCAPGNAGTSEVAENRDVAASDHDALVGLCAEEAVDLVVIGPEIPLAAGLGDRLRDAGLLVFGPGASGARIEGSKLFAKNLMQRYGIPSATFRSFDRLDSARTYLESLRHFPVVIKADGLAAGKGVVLPDTLEAALADAESMLEGGRFGASGSRIVVEECLRGRELSVLAITDGKAIVVLEPAQDFKRIRDRDEGANTGGMGSFCPAPVATPAVMERTTSEILVRLVHAFSRERIPYRGVIYAGLMVTRGGPKVIEFNCRFGDPEIQSVLLRLRSDLVPLLVGCATGKLGDAEPLDWDERPSVCVVAASRGYPESSSSGDVISGLGDVAQMDDVQVFHAGTRRDGNRVVTAGGRVLGVTALGDDVAHARERAYEAMSKIRFDGMQFRTDIAADPEGR